MEVTNYGHACYGIKVNNKHLLFDPFITPNELAAHINIADVKADYILISHGHEDHVADVIDIAKRTHAKIVSNFEIVNWFGSKGIENGHPMNHGGTWEFDFGKVKYVTAHHSSTMPDGTTGGNPGGFIISSSEGTFYFAGDTALSMDMQLIPNWAKLDFALLPIGDNFTMDVDDAVTAAGMIQCNNIIGMHYDTFGFIKIDKDDAMAKFNSSGITLKLLEIGETQEI